MTGTISTPVTTDRIGRLLDPGSIAIVGASPRNHLSRGVLNNLTEFAFSGDVYPVNPNYDEIDGYKCYPDLASIGAAPDLAVLLVPADAVPGVAAQAVAAGVGAIVIMSAGFGEDERGSGRDRERALRDALAGTGVAVSGPNSEGYYNVTRGIPLTFSGSVARSAIQAGAVAAIDGSDALDAIKGGVAVVAQSGGLGFSIFGRGIERGIGFSHIVSVGNELDVDVLECAQYLLDQPEVRVVAMYVEGFRRPERLRAVAEQARRAGKTLVIGKAGDSSSGSAAAMSHTGHLAGESRINDAVFADLGIVAVRDQEEFLDACAALSTLPPVYGDRVAVVSWSGGLAVWTADACERAGFTLPPLNDEVREELSGVLPEFANINNPIDVTGAGKENPGQILSRIAKSGGFDAFVLIAPLNHPGVLAAEIPEIAKVVTEGGKPVVVYSYTRPAPENIQVLSATGLPIFESSSRAAFALTALRIAGARTAPVAAELVSPPDGAARRTLSERETTALLAEAGFPVTQQSLATTVEEAVHAASRIGRPVALKVQAPSMPHKKDAGGLALNVAGDAAVRDTYHELMARTADYGDVEGVLVQEMVPAGVEMIVGVSNTAGFGPIIMVGFGGSGVEHLADTTLRAAPLDAEAVRSMLADLRHGALLTEPLGGLSKLAVDQVVDFVVRVSAYAVQHADRLLELDINPLVVTANRVTLVDALMVAVED